MNVLGLDIGTTTLCAVITDSDSGAVLCARTAPNGTDLANTADYERAQQPDVILERCLALAQELCEQYAPVAAIGVTGQMHGIVYIDRDGRAVSPLYTWQDESGNQPFSDTESYAAHLSALTGYKMASGFGLCTCYVHTLQNRVPEGAVCICTIHDYVAMHLTGRTTPVMHTSDAASFGLFDLKALSFDTAAIEKAGLSAALLPEVVRDFTVIGTYNGIPVTCAIGDNQASFIGSVSDMENSVLVNMGTGGQVSFLTGSAEDPGLEVRPCCGDKYICVGASLCGGRAFACLEKFLRSCAEIATGQKIDSAYPGMDRFLAGVPSVSDPLTVDTRFAGTREAPALRGSIQNIGTENFTARHLILGTMEGIVAELLDMYNASDHAEHATLVCSGNGLRKNDALRNLFGLRFGMQTVTPVHKEEAAYGAALSALTAAGLKDSLSHAQALIQYQK